MVDSVENWLLDHGSKIVKQNRIVALMKFIFTQYILQFLRLSVKIQVKPVIFPFVPNSP